MKNILYYPGFESNDINFLKMALIYFDDLHIILPPSARKELSKEFEFAMNESDLLKAYVPRMNESNLATIKTIEKVYFLLSENSLYDSIFGRDYINKWKNKENHNMEIYKDKYNRELNIFLKENGLCTMSDNGIFLNSDLGMIFMSYLAFEIRDQNKLNIMSDIKRVSEISSLIDSKSEIYDNLKNINAVKKIINLQIPNNLSDIPIKQIIELRNSKGYIQNLRAFHNCVDSYLESKNLNEANIRKMIKDIEEHKKELQIKDKLSSICEILSFAITSYTAYRMPGLGIEDLTNIASLGILIENIITLYHSTRLSDDESRAKSYLADLSSLRL